MGNKFGIHGNPEEKLCTFCSEDYRASISPKHSNRFTENALEPIPKAAERGHAQCLQVLIKDKAFVRKRNRRDVYEYAINYAARNGHVECMNVLIKPGADINGTDKCRILLREAAGRGKKEALQWLIEKEARVNMPYGTETALLRAVTSGHCECADMLLRAGADINADIIYGRTTLFYAVLLERNSSNPCIDLLLQAGADVNGANNWGFTPLFEASRFGNVSRIKTLIKARADVNTRNFLSESALHASVMINVVTDQETLLNRAETTKLLLRSGVKINLVNRDNMNALCGFIDKARQSNNPPDRNMVVLLYAAGEKLDGITTVENNNIIIYFLEYLEKREICLKHLCREAIRKHLLQLNKRSHLFGRMPQLGLPPLLR